MSDTEIKVPRPTRWVWFETEHTTDVFARARRTFTLDGVPEKAALHITASGHYRLWVNGAFAGRGPSRPTVRVKRYDVLDITQLLREGENVLAVHLIHYGYHTAHCLECPGGLWCELDIHIEHSEKRGLTPTSRSGLSVPVFRVSSDTHWRFSPDPAYDRGAGRRNQCYGIIEIYDARRQDEWTAPDFDDSSWLRAIWCSDDPVLPPWKILGPRGIPQAREESILPKAIVRIGEVWDQEFAPRIIGGAAIANLGSYLLQDVPIDPEYTAVENAESLLQPGGEPAVITQPSPLDQDESHQRAATIILDFGREITGFGWIDVEGNRRPRAASDHTECLRRPGDAAEVHRAVRRGPAPLGHDPQRLPQHQLHDRLRPLVGAGGDGCAPVRR